MGTGVAASSLMARGARDLLRDARRAGLAADSRTVLTVVLRLLCIAPV